jgi:hypothetical protein
VKASAQVTRAAGRRPSRFAGSLIPSWRLSLAAGRKSPKTVSTYLDAADQLLTFAEAAGMSTQVAAMKREHIEAGDSEMRIADTRFVISSGTSTLRLMAAIGPEAGLGVSLSRGALILIGIAVLLVGGAAGFGAGYRVEANRTKSADTGTAPTGESKVLTQFRVCMARKGIHWPTINGKLAPVGTPPPGVSLSTYYKAVGACYRDS